MLGDRIILNLLNFINSLLWFRAKQVKEPPYLKIGKAIYGDLGVLQQIKKKVAPGVPDRQITSWMFMPRRHSGERKKELKDIHIDCSFTGTVSAGEKVVTGKVSPAKSAKKRDPRVPQYQVSVLRASHWINPKTQQWEFEEIHVDLYDFQGSQPHPERFAPLIIKLVAMQLLQHEWHQIDWDFEIKQSRKQVMGAWHTPGKVPPIKVNRIVAINNRLMIEYERRGNPNDPDKT